MEVVVLSSPSEEDWKRCLYLGRVTQGHEWPENPPSSEWRKKIILSEHSPIRTLRWCIELRDIPYCNSVHFVRHKFGVEHYVRSQRSNEDRGAERQDAPVTHVMDINAAELIAMSRKRLCNKADPTTRMIMEMIRSAVVCSDPEMKYVLVPECVYRGNRCPELKGCGRFPEINKE